MSPCGSHQSTTPSQTSRYVAEAGCDAEFSEYFSTLSKLPLLQDALLEFAKFEAELKVKSTHLSNLRVDISDPTASLSMLKGECHQLSTLLSIHAFSDKSAGGRVSAEFEDASQKLQDYCECLGIEVNERINILDMLKECKTFTAYRLAELHRTFTVSVLVATGVRGDMGSCLPLRTTNL